ncbi:MAG: rhodanese-like domain-containing protein [Pseudomonadota bacterium]
MLSPLSARKAEKLGYTNVKVFHAGLPAWKKGGNPLVSDLENLDRLGKNPNSYILLDLRSKDLIEKSHVPNAVGAAAGYVEPLKDKFPAYKSAPIIIYNQDGTLKGTEAALKAISDWGYKQVSVLEGGFVGWEKAGKPIAKGPAAADIKYVRTLAPGEMEVDAFKALVEKPSPDKTVIDVRNASEYKDGALPGALNYPLDDLEASLAKLPKDKTLVLHCGTGARAEMAYGIVKKAGLTCTFVKATVDFDKDEKGKYTITEE